MEVALNYYKDYYVRNGTIGDFIAGVSGTLFSLSAFIIVYFTYIDQKEDLKKEKIEERFFELLKLHKENVSEIQINNLKEPCEEIKGRQAFNFIYEQVQICYKEIAPFFVDTENKQIYLPSYLPTIENLMLTNDSLDGVQLAQCDIAYDLVFFGVNYDDITVLLRLFSEVYQGEFIRKVALYISAKPLDKDLLLHWEKVANTVNKLEVVNSIENFRHGIEIANPNNLNYYHHHLKKILATPNFSKFYAGHQDVIGHYYRHIFQTVKYINKQSLLTYDEKYEYIKTLRAQLSTVEQYLFFFNSISFMGRSWEFNSLKQDSTKNDVNNYLVTKFSFIKNIPNQFIFQDIVLKNYYPLVHFEFEAEPLKRAAVAKLFN
ncbi:hypothetical protein GCM10022210_31230 [Mucilaginibacter dorajii]|uniref:Phage abortive infection protein n=2 Tax=Mucilaginibacter dorajii TaxID=692994 RepID=A0ABP7Q879_9SPHI